MPIFVLFSAFGCHGSISISDLSSSPSLNKVSYKHSNDLHFNSDTCTLMSKPLHFLMLFLVVFCSLIGPQKYCSDYRPYFTIHDSEFKEYTTKTQAPYVHGLNSILNCFLVLKLHCLLHVHCN